MIRVGLRHVVIALVTIPLMSFAKSSIYEFVMHPALPAGYSSIRSHADSPWWMSVAQIFLSSIWCTSMAIIVSRRSSSEPWVAGAVWWATSAFLSVSSLSIYVAKAYLAGSWSLPMQYLVLPMVVSTLYALVGALFVVAGYHFGNLVSSRNRSSEKAR